MRLDSRMRARPSAEVNSVMMRPQPDCWLVVSAVDVWNPRLRIETWGTRFGSWGELAGVADEAAEDGVGDTGHGSEDGGRRDAHIADGEAGGDAAVLGHRVLGGRVPLLLLEGVALLHTSPV